MMRLLKLEGILYVVRERERERERGIFKETHCNVIDILNRKY